MTDIQAMKDTLAGLRNRKKTLLDNEKAFLKASGLNDEIEKAEREKEKYQTDLLEAKKKRDEAQTRKANAIAKVTSEIERKMNRILPFGGAVFYYDEDKNGSRSMRIGWSEAGITTPYNGLSGGQKQIFDAALANVLDADIIVIEAAELDRNNLQKTIEELAKIDKQVIINTWIKIDFDIPDEFKIMEV